MIEILARLDVKPPYPSAGEMVNAMKQLEKEFRKRERERFLSAEARKAPFLGSKRESLASSYGLFKRRLTNLFKDLNHYIDFSLARYIVWRETRRRRKAAINKADEQKSADVE